MITFLHEILSLISAFFRWWFSELAALIPPPLRRLFRQGGERLLLEIDDEETRLYRLRGNHAELLGSGTDIQARQGKSAGVILVLPHNKMVTRETELPLAAEENLREVLGFEMDRLTPFSQTQVYYDFRVTERDTKRERIKLSILLSPRQMIDGLITEAERRGLTVKAVDVSTGETGKTLGLNLLPARAVVRSSRLGQSVAAALTVTAALLLFLAVEIPLQRKADYAEALSQRVAEERNRVAALRKLEQEIAGLQNQGTALGDLKRSDNLTLALVDQVTRLLPDDAWLTQLSLAGDRLQLAGFSPASSKLLTTFEESPLFTETVFRAPVTQDPRLGLERFSLSLKVLPKQDKP